jgi:Zn-dependent M28 family amino/carboxypeptidase
VTAPVQGVDLKLAEGERGTSTSGCEASDFSGFTAGSIALIQRGTCTFETKVTNAQAAGASAVILFNQGNTPERSELFVGTLGKPFTIPVVGASFAHGAELAQSGTTARVFTSTTNERRPTYNVLAESPGGDASRVVMLGAHLDSVSEGPGINDNGTGSAALLEVARQAKDINPTNKLRFAWWGAEEAGLLGSEHYVEQLTEAQLAAIDLYLNFDMVGSPNFVRFVYDGDNSTEEGQEGPAGSAAIEKSFLDYFASQNLPTAPTAFDGRSDYGPFIAAGIPSGGLFTGAEGVKTAEEAALFGGEAGKAYDPNYHEAGDTITNVDRAVFEQMADAIADAVIRYAFARTALKPSPLPSTSATPTATMMPSATATASVTPSGPVVGGPCSVRSSMQIERTTINATGSTGVTVTTASGATVDLFAYTQPSRTFRLVRTTTADQQGVARFRPLAPRPTRGSTSRCGAARRTPQPAVR